MLTKFYLSNHTYCLVIGALWCCESMLLGTGVGIYDSLCDLMIALNGLTSASPLNSAWRARYCLSL